MELRKHQKTRKYLENHQIGSFWVSSQKPKTRNAYPLFSIWKNVYTHLQVPSNTPKNPKNHQKPYLGQFHSLLLYYRLT